MPRIFLPLILLFSAPATLGLATTGGSEPDKGLATVLETETGEIIPAGAWGIVHIAPPWETSLYKLRGVAGQGFAVLRSMEEPGCLTLPIRFVAGDFGGPDPSQGSGKPILMEIRNKGAAQILARGKDIVSDQYGVGLASDGTQADILIMGGLSEKQGFVLNPGDSILNDIFGARVEAVSCKALLPAGPPPTN
jgi:hypothetical protein